jgi:hypothetical protein
MLISRYFHTGETLFYTRIASVWMSGATTCLSFQPMIPPVRWKPATEKWGSGRPASGRVWTQLPACDSTSPMKAYSKKNDSSERVCPHATERSARVILAAAALPSSTVLRPPPRSVPLHAHLCRAPSLSCPDVLHTCATSRSSFCNI